jgi:diguanylate cyclase (GGDEF)-like protein/PAS domain S-box-containing protein
MTLRKATIVLTCLGALALLATLSIAAHSILDASFKALEDDQARKNLIRAKNAVDEEIQKLDEIIVDWALWDDSVRFMRGGGKDFLASNLNDRTLNFLCLRAILFLGLDGRPRWAAGFDPVNGVRERLPEGLLERFASGSPLLVAGNAEDRIKGLLRLPEGIYIAAACPILDSEGRGPALGTMVMLRSFDVRQAALIAERMRLPLGFERMETPPSADIAPLAAQLTRSGDMVVDDVSRNVMAGVMLLPDMVGEPAVRLVVREPRDIMTIGDMAMRRTYFWMSASALLFLAALLFFLERRVLSRLQRLTFQVDSLGAPGGTVAIGRVDMPGTDELAVLARRINATLAELERSRQSLATQCTLTEAQEGYLLQILDSIQTGVLLVDPQTDRILECNAFAATAVGMTREEILGRLCQGIIRLEEESCAIGEAGKGSEQCLGRLLRGDGSSLAVIKSSSHIERGGRRLLLETFIDVEDLHRAQEALKRSEEVYRTIFMNTGTATILIEADTTISLANQEFEKLSGVPRREIEGKRRWTEFFDPEDVEWMLLHHVKRRQSPGLAPRNYETRFINHLGERRIALLTVAMIPGTQISVASIEDITERKKAEEQLRHQAFHDALTGLPNRLLLLDRMERSVESARREGERVAVLLMDLDRFKDINDTLGHSAGDQLLNLVGQRLLGAMRRSDTVARLGGDEFVVVVDAPGGEEAVSQVARHILACFAEPFDLGGHTLHVRLSVGIAMFPEHGDIPDMLLKNADLAMYRAKERGRNTFDFYTSELNDQAVRRLSIETALRRALDSGGIEVFYQPKVELTAPGMVPRLTGAEALVRMRREDGTLVPPADFISIAEDTGLILPLATHVLGTACRQAAAWRAKRPDFVIAVNLSPRQFLRPGLAARALGIVRAAGLPPEAVEFEITENLLLDSRAETIAALDELDASGAAVVLDDFGKEYSSLGYIKKLPIEAIKIDRSFIDDLPRDEDDAAIVKSILAMAETLELRVVAEGVETAEQLDFLTGIGCREFQGYHFSRPLPAAEMETLLDRPEPFGPDKPAGLDADGGS